MRREIDGITLEVIRNALQSIAEEMGVTLIRTSLSPNIKDRMDCSSALYSKEGKLISQAEHIPLHLGLMPSVVEKVLKIYSTEELEEGDAILINDPYISGSHLPDIFLLSPVFYKGQLVAIVGNIAHHVDVGGMTPGSSSTQAYEIFQEGLRIPAVRIRRKGVIDDGILRLFQANCRSRDTVGDLYAQIAANNVGEKRLKDLFERHNVEFLSACFDEIMAYSDRRMRAAIYEVPNGEYMYEDVLEGDGINNDMLKIKVKVSIKDEEIDVDLTGTDDQAKGPVNSTLGVTKGCVYYAIKALIDPDVPPNAGSYRSINVIAPKGTIVNAAFPAAVSNANTNTSQRIVDTIFGAMAQLMPDKSMAACSGSMNSLTIGGINQYTGNYFSYVETCGGGQGAINGMDGMDGVHTNMTNTLNTPVEVIEQSYPFVIKQYSLATNSGGSGKHRGGLGIIREIIFENEDTNVTLKLERSKIRPWGLLGGKSGEGSKCSLTKSGTSEHIDIPIKSTFKVNKGDTLFIQTAGGGGYLEPNDRDLSEIKRDLMLGTITIDHARNDYCGKL